MFDKNFRDLYVKDVYEFIGKEPAVVTEGAKIKDAFDAMIKNPVTRKVYVVDKEGKLIGMITLETMLRHLGYRVGVREVGVLSFMKFLSEMLKENVEEIMMKKPVKVTKKHLLLDATRLMVEYHLNDLPVVDREDKLIGELNVFEVLVHGRNIFKEK